MRAGYIIFACKLPKMKRVYYLSLFFIVMLVAIDSMSAATTNSTTTSQVPSHNEQAPPLSEQAQISLLTSSSSDEYVYTVYGHTALRVYDPQKKLDIVFNYGIFDFSKPNFIYRFAKGETDYMLKAYDFKYYIIEYIERGSDIFEQVLNLLPEEKEALWQALYLNEHPENRVYRYNFFFDNCATRPVVMIENNINGVIKYAPQTEFPTFRDAINYCTRNHPWTTFGCDLIMGAPTDRIMTLKETFFLPAYLQEAFDKAVIVRNGTTEPLIIKTNILNKEEIQAEHKPSALTSPLACFTLFLLLILLVTWQEWQRRTYYRWVDCLLFFMAGIAGCIMFFLSFISVHPSMFPNISLLWLHPLHFIGVIVFSVKKFKNMAFWYHFINFAAISTMSVAWFLIPQHFNVAFIPLIASLWLRSGWGLLRKQKSIG